MARSSKGRRKADDALAIDVKTEAAWPLLVCAILVAILAVIMPMLSESYMRRNGMLLESGGPALGSLAFEGVDIDIEAGANRVVEKTEVVIDYVNDERCYFNDYQACCIVGEENCTPTKTMPKDGCLPTVYCAYDESIGCFPLFNYGECIPVVDDEFVPTAWIVGGNGSEDIADPYKYVGYNSGRDPIWRTECGGIEDREEEAICLVNLARREANSYYCEFVNDERWIDSCYYWVAKVTHDPADCSGPYGYYEKCLDYVVDVVNNTQLCNAIDPEWDDYREECLETAGRYVGSAFLEAYREGREIEE